MIVAADGTKKKISMGIKMMVIQAPSANFASSTTITVIPVTKRAETIYQGLLTQCGPRFFLQCTTMPDCESVKARNAPTA